MEIEWEQSKGCLGMHFKERVVMIPLCGTANYYVPVSWKSVIHMVSVTSEPPMHDFLPSYCTSRPMVACVWIRTCVCLSSHVPFIPCCLESYSALAALCLTYMNTCT